MKVSAGTLLYRLGRQGLEVLLVRPFGPAARYGWSIPKGLVDEGESLEEAARRETFEETGVAAAELFALGAIQYTKSRKQVHCFGGAADVECAPRRASWEVTEAKFIPLEEASRLLHPDQRPLLVRLASRLGVSAAAQASTRPD